jgi:hypothetical protein
MDVEKTIEFLLSTQADFAARQVAADARLTRIEALTVSNAEDIKGLAGKLGELAQIGIETDKRIDRLIILFDEQDRKLAERIDNLVSGIGEFMRRDVPPNTLS